MKAIIAVTTLLLGIAVILAGNGLLGTLLGVRGELEGFSSSTLGLIMGGYFAGFVAGTFFVPRWVRLFGHIRVFAALASLASIATLLHGLLVVPWFWLILRALAGACIVGIYVVIESWLNERTDNAHRGQVFSAYMTTTLIGLGIGQLLLLAGPIDSLQLFALASVLLSAGLIPVALTRVKEPVLTESARLSIRALYAISPLGVVACAFAGVGSGAFWGLAPVFAAGIGLSAGGIAAFMSLTILGGIMMMWPVGLLSDHFERRKVLLAVCAMTTLTPLAAWVLMSGGLNWLFLGGWLYGAFAFSIYALATAHTNDHVSSEQMLEVSSSMQLLWGTGAIIGPVVAGILMQTLGPAALLPFISVAALIPALFALYRMQVSAPIAADDQGAFVPQFATSPVALEMHPEQPDEDEAEDKGDDQDAVTEANSAAPNPNP